MSRDPSRGMRTLTLRASDAMATRAREDDVDHADENHDGNDARDARGARASTSGGSDSLRSGATAAGLGFKCANSSVSWPIDELSVFDTANIAECRVCGDVDATDRGDMRETCDCGDFTAHVHQGCMARWVETQGTRCACGKSFQSVARGLNGGDEGSVHSAHVREVIFDATSKRRRTSAFAPPTAEDEDARRAHLLLTAAYLRLTMDVHKPEDMRTLRKLAPFCDGPWNEFLRRRDEGRHRGGGLWNKIKKKFGFANTSHGGLDDDARVGDGRWSALNGDGEEGQPCEVFVPLFTRAPSRESSGGGGMSVHGGTHFAAGELVTGGG